MITDAYKRLAKLYEKCTGLAASPNSQMCLFWSTDDPPDVLQCTESLELILDEFAIDLSEDEAVDLYDIELQKASAYLQSKAAAYES